MTEPIEPEIVERRETEDLRPVPPGRAGVRWGAMRIALLVVIAFLVFFFVWLAFWH